MEPNLNHNLTQIIIECLNIDLENPPTSLNLSVVSENGIDKISLEKTIDEKNYFQVNFNINSEELENLKVDIGTQVDEFHAPKVKTFSQKLAFLLSVLVSNQYLNFFYDIYLLMLNFENIEDVKDYSESELNAWLEDNFEGYTLSKKHKD